MTLAKVRAELHAAQEEYTAAAEAYDSAVAECRRKMAEVEERLRVAALAVTDAMEIVNRVEDEEAPARRFVAEYDPREKVTLPLSALGFPEAEIEEGLTFEVSTYPVEE